MRKRSPTLHIEKESLRNLTGPERVMLTGLEAIGDQEVRLVNGGNQPVENSLAGTTATARTSSVSLSQVSVWPSRSFVASVISVITEPSFIASYSVVGSY